jgi:hypothetical protein
MPFPLVGHEESHESLAYSRDIDKSCVTRPMYAREGENTGWVIRGGREQQKPSQQLETSFSHVSFEPVFCPKFAFLDVFWNVLLLPTYRHKSISKHPLLWQALTF